MVGKRKKDEEDKRHIDERKCLYNENERKRVDNFILYGEKKWFKLDQ